MREQTISDMLAGRIDPFIVANSTVRKGETSTLVVRALDQSIIEFLKTGVFISPELDYTSIFSDGGNLRKIAERIARYNYHVATLISTDRDLISDVAFTLFQILESSPTTLEERRRLLKEFYPSIGGRDLQPEVLFHVNYIALDLYSKLSQSNKKYFREVLRFGLEALKYSDDPSVKGSEELCRVFFWLGVSLNETGRQDIEQLNKSVSFLKQCIENKEHCHGRFLGSTLNSLGYSLLLLGRLKGDSRTIQEAVATFKKALSYRVGDQERRLTEANLASAERSLTSEILPETDSNYESLLRQIDYAGRKFKEVMAEKLKGENRDSRLKAGMDELLKVAPRVNVEGDPYLQARFELVLGIGLVYSGDSAAAVCFLKAAVRKWEKLDTSDNLPRKTAAYYNLGLAFATMEGSVSKYAYANSAIENLEHAKTLFAELGSEERVKVCETFIAYLKRKVDES
jgi:hypothetical protein